jgi:hypothetical protein
MIVGRGDGDENTASSLEPGRILGPPGVHAQLKLAAAHQSGPRSIVVDSGGRELLVGWWRVGMAG